jgi:hypothetical protein
VNDTHNHEAFTHPSSHLKKKKLSPGDKAAIISLGKHDFSQVVIWSFEDSIASTCMQQRKKDKMCGDCTEPI